MSYDIYFKGINTDILTVNSEQGKVIFDLFMAGKKSTPFSINGNAYLIGDIKRIEKAADPQPVIQPERQISGPAPRPGEPGSGCRGQFSIQREINNIAQDAGGKQGPDNPDGRRWSQLIKDNRWREAIRKKLLATGQPWCDYKSGKCACDQPAQLTMQA